MKKSLFNICAIGVGAVLSFAPLAGNAYYCTQNKICSDCIAKAESHKITNRQDKEILSTLNIKAKSFVLMEKSSGEILLEKDSLSSYPMASMTKMMTLLIVMEEIEKGNIDINQTTRTSEFSAGQEGSQCFLDANKDYLVKELIKSVVVASANDATVALAELVSGSEELFARRMNDRATKLGMTTTHFINSTGLDAKGHVSSARDMCLLMRELSKHTRLQEFSHVWNYDMVHPGGRITNLTNTNRLVRTNKDLVLAKTGHTDGAGYCITALGEREGSEYIACVMGEEKSEDRFLDATKLLNFAFTNYQVVTLSKSSEPVSTISVKGGKLDEISVYTNKDVSVILEKGVASSVQKIIDLPQQIKAPIMANSKVGQVTYKIQDEEIVCDLIVKETVEEKSIMDIAKELM